MEHVHAMEKVSTNPHSTLWCRWKMSEPKVPASPLLHKCGKEGTGETECETEEPQNVHADSITWGPK